MDYYKLKDEENTKPVVNQPMAVANNIAVGVNNKKIRREWSIDLCDCCVDCSECMCAFFCSQCYLYQLYARSGEGFCDCICGGILPLRTKIRTERGIQGSIGNDVCITTWCPCCSLIQMGMELKTTNSLV